MLTLKNVSFVVTSMLTSFHLALHAAYSLGIPDTTLAPEAPFLGNPTLQSRGRLVLPKTHAPTIKSSISRSATTFGKRHYLPTLLIQGYHLVWRKYDVIMNSTLAYAAQFAFYDGLKDVVHGLSDNGSLALTGQLAFSLGALHLRFNNLPHEGQRAQDFILQLAAGMLAWLLSIPGGIIFGVFEIVAYSWPDIVELWMDINDAARQVPLILARVR